jgi:hypothetical protein
VKEKERKNKRAWTSAEVATLRKHADLGVRALAELLDRSPESITLAAHRYRISLRRKGERRGKILGQTGRWIDGTPGADPVRLAVIREEALAGMIDLAALEQRVRDHVHGPRRPLCPSCGQREQERPTTGLCEVCHLRLLAQMHRDEVERRDARRELWQSRQEKSRAKRRGTRP